MSSFGRGVRLELKRQSIVFTGSSQVLLSVPANANYFIFLNRSIQNNSTGSSSITKKHGDTSNLGANISLTDPQLFKDFLTNASNEDLSERIIYPGDSFITNSSSATPHNMTYTKVYFGGLSDY